MDVTDLIRRAGRICGDSSNIVISQQDWFDFINEAQLDICRNTDCLTGATVFAAGDYPKNKPDDFIRLITVAYGDHVLQLTSVDDLDRRGIQRDISGEPEYAFIANNVINLFPNPITADTTTINLKYSRTPVEVDDTGDSLELPDALRDLMVNFIASRGFDRLKNYSAASSKMQEYRMTLGEQISEALIVDDTYSVIRDDVWEDW